MTQKLLTHPDLDTDRLPSMPAPTDGEEELNRGQRRSPLYGLWRSMRPKQWIKNCFLFAGLVFTLDHRHPPHDILLVLVGFVLFSLLSSSVYLLNDVADR